MTKNRAQRHAAKLAEFEKRCGQLGTPLTVQRRAVLEVLLHRADHPTADDVYNEVIRRLPHVSRGTVYRALETMVQLGLATRVSHPGSVTHYDAKTHRHHHLICDQCGRIDDFDSTSLDKLSVRHASALGFRVRDYSVQISGLCRNCAQEH